MMSALMVDVRSCCGTPLTVPTVPTGMKIGVCMVPRDVSSVPALADEALSF